MLLDNHYVFSVTYLYSKKGKKIKKEVKDRYSDDLDTVIVLSISNLIISPNSVFAVPQNIFRKTYFQNASLNSILKQKNNYRSFLLLMINFSYAASNLNNAF